ncbi:MAG: glycosyltransferase family 39 protein [Thermoanaerobaculia bacterium]
MNRSPIGRLAATIVILLLATLLRFGHLQHRSLDNDEIAEARWSSLPFSEMMEEVRRDVVHPPADYLVQFVVGRIGPEWVRSLPSVAAGIASVGLLLFLGTSWVSWRAGAFAALLLAVSPMHVFYSQEVRPYASALFWILASLAALERFATTGRLRWAAGWFALVFAAGGTLYFAGMIAASGGIVRILLDRSGRLDGLKRRLPLLIAGWAILYSPWFAVIRAAAGRPSPVARQAMNWEWWTWRLQSLAVGSDRTWEPVSLASWIFWGCVAIGAILSTRLRLLRVAAFLFLAGTAMVIFLLQLHPHYPTVRYLMPSWIGAFLLAGAALDWCSRRWMSVPLVVAVLAFVIGGSAIKLDEYYRGDRSDWREVAVYVHDRIRPGDTLVAANPWVSRNFGYYWHQLPPVPDLTIKRYAPDRVDLVGPAWIVTGGCFPREAARAAPLMKQFPRSELAEVRYLRPQRRMPAHEELCPE